MGIWRRSARRWLASAATLPLLVGGLTLVVASPADASPCPHPGWSNKDGGSGHVIADSTALRDGPGSSCTLIALVHTNALLYYHCLAVNPYSGNTWTHLRIAGTSVDGWISDDNLDDHGATQPC
jgi:hypothetical protein